MKLSNSTTAPYYPLPYGIHPPTRKVTIDLEKDIPTVGLISAILLNGLLWYVIDSTNQVGSWIAIAVILLTILMSFILLAKQQFAHGFMLITYLAAMQPAIREQAPQLPFLTLEYLTPVWLFLILRNIRGGVHATLPVFFYGIYIFLEILGLLFVESISIGRGILIPSIVFFFFLFMSSNVTITLVSFQSLLSGYLVGIGGIAALISRAYFSGNQIVWLNESNFSTSGEMGPVQISMLLSVGIFVCIIFAGSQEKLNKVFYVGFALVLSYLMLLTFSRNGLYLLVIAILSYFLLFRRPNLKMIFGLFLILVASYVIFQASINATQGLALERYSDTSTSNRIELVKHGWDIFLDNPLFGVGTGNYHSVVSRAEYFGRTSGAHNELIRAASEHGILGLLFWGLFAFSSVRLVLKQPGGKSKALQMTFLLIGFAYMFVNGLKLFVQPVLFFMALSQYYKPTQASNLDGGYNRG